MNERQIKHITKLIRREVAYFNGWSVSEETMEKDCRKAALNVAKYLTAKSRKAEEKA